LQYNDGIIVGSAIVKIIAEKSALGEGAIKDEVSTFVSSFLRALREQ